MFDPTGLDVDQRVARLEDAAREYAAMVRESDELTVGVTRLGDNTEALADLLRTVNENALALSRVERKTEEVAFVAEEKAATAKIERKLFLRRAYMAAAATLALTLGTVIGGAWLTDRHFQQCVLHGPDNQEAQDFCNLTFPGHNHPQDITLEALLRRGAENQIRAVEAQRAGCERTNTRLKAQIERERALALADVPATREIHQKAADSLEATLIQDCAVAYPLPAFGGTR